MKTIKILFFKQIERNPSDFKIGLWEVVFGWARLFFSREPRTERNFWIFKIVGIVMYAERF